MHADSPQNTRLWIIACHLSALAGLIGIPFGNVLGPLIVWLIKKADIPEVEDQGKESLNFQITMAIAGAVAFVLCFVFIGFLLFPAVIIFDLVYVVIASIKTSNGETYRYPYTLRLIK